MNKIRKLDEGDIAEIMEFYDGTFGSVKELAKRFKVSITRIRWITNYKNFREEQTFRSRNWRKNNLEKVKKINNRSRLKYYYKNNSHILKNQKSILELFEKYGDKTDDAFFITRKQIRRKTKLEPHKIGGALIGLVRKKVIQNLGVKNYKEGKLYKYKPKNSKSFPY